MRRIAWGIVSGIVVLAGMTAYVSGHRPRQPQTADPVPYAPNATVKDLMDAIVDPSADDVWNAVKTTVDPRGIQDAAPATDEDWAAVRRGAIRLVEAANLLMMPGRHMARPGERSETPGVELEPGQMEALVDRDRAAWNQRAAALRDVSREVLRAADAHDAAALFEVGGRLDTACENCHRQYWYPNEHVPEFPSHPSGAAKGE